jgi:hypothetical protein
MPNFAWLEQRRNSSSNYQTHLLKGIMKKILFLSVALSMVLSFSGCKETSSSLNYCHITGEVTDSGLEGVSIYLVPYYGPKDAAHVDSAEIKNGQFEFSIDTLMLANIIVDYHYRMNTQQLLVVTEPGELKVKIGVDSSASGTEQNDILQSWKIRTEQHNTQYTRMNRTAREAEKAGDSITYKTFKAKADSVHLKHKQYTRELASSLKEGILHDFLKDLFPLTYTRKYPDGKEVVFDADTNQPIEE